MQGDVRKISVRARLNIFKFDSRCIMKPSLCVCVTKVVVTSSVSISAEEGTGVMRITGFISFHNSFDQFCNFFFFFKSRRWKIFLWLAASWKQTEPNWEIFRASISLSDRRIGVFAQCDGVKGLKLSSCLTDEAIKPGFTALNWTRRHEVIRPTHQRSQSSERSSHKP